MLCSSVKYVDAIAVCAQRLCCHHQESTRLLSINTSCDLSLLENSQVHVRMGHSVQGRLQVPVLTVPDVVCSEMDRTYRPLSAVLTSPHRTARKLTHTQLMWIVFTSFAAVSTPPAAPIQNRSGLPRSPHNFCRPVPVPTSRVLPVRCPPSVPIPLPP